MSVLASTSLPLACSGDMYAAVPTTIPSTDPLTFVGIADICDACDRVVTAFARPKSSTFTTPAASA
jgi:hypothetical protein